MQLVEKHVINRQHQFWKECDQLAFKSKDLYNAANYIQRKYFFDQESGTGRFINADVNGSLNIGRKVIPDFMKGIEGLPFIPVVVDPLRMHLTTSA